jgi:hypothetical protein
MWAEYAHAAGAQSTCGLERAGTADNHDVGLFNDSEELSQGQAAAGSPHPRLVQTARYLLPLFAFIFCPGDDDITACTSAELCDDLHILRQTKIAGTSAVERMHNDDRQFVCKTGRQLMINGIALDLSEKDLRLYGITRHSQVNGEIAEGAGNMPGP